METGKKTKRERNVEYQIRSNFEEVPYFDSVESAVPVGKREADLVVKKDGKELILIEVKKKDIDPFKHDVVDQAHYYAGKKGIDYFATTNGIKFILFKTHESGKGVMERKLKVFDVNEKLSELVFRHINEGREWLHFDDAFLMRLRSLHDSLVPYVRENLLKNLEKNKNFEKEFEEWVESQGFPYKKISDKERVWDIVSNQSVYLLINKILFYKLLETVYPKLPKLRIKQSLNIAKYLESFFEEAREIDYEAVFEESIFNRFSIPLEITETLSKFVKELEDYNFNEIKKSDVIGRIYEKLIPKEKRKSLGQYYTPPKIIDLILEMTVKKDNDKILDPCCGSGGFLIRSYQKLADLKGISKVKKQNEHQDILDQLVGVEINQFPAHLSAINLQMQNIQFEADDIFIFVSDFFDIKSEDWFKSKYETAHPNKENKKSSIYKHFDCVVGNPPYIRQEIIKEKDKLQKITKEEEANLDKTSDIYSYFFVHGTNFLKNNGRLGFITSNKWSEVKYGKSLQNFFLNKHKIIAIIEFDAGAFEEVDVNTCVTILEKEKNEEERDNNTVKFVRVKEKMNIDELVRFIQTTEKSYEDDKVRLIPVKQSKLKEEDKWNIYLRAPEVYQKIIKNEKIIRLGDVARVKSGIKTGADDFFLFNKDKAQRLGISKKYLSPIITTDDKKDSLEIKKTNNFIFSVHQKKENIESKKILEYINQGEKRGYSRRRSVGGRKRWYDIGKNEKPPILLPCKNWEEFRAFKNTSKALNLKQFYGVFPNSDIDIILAQLNSSLSQLFMELKGRSYGAGVLEILIYETKDLPILDPNELTPKEKQKIKNEFNVLVKKYGTKEQEKAQKELDNIIFDILGLSKEERKEIYEAIETAFNMRKKRKEKKVLV